MTFVVRREAYPGPGPAREDGGRAMWTAGRAWLEHVCACAPCETAGARGCADARALRAEWIAARDTRCRARERESACGPAQETRAGTGTVTRAEVGPEARAEAARPAPVYGSVAPQAPAEPSCGAVNTTVT